MPVEDEQGSADKDEPTASPSAQKNEVLANCSSDDVSAAPTAASHTAQRDAMIADCELLRNGTNGARNLINTFEQQTSADPDAEPISKPKSDLAVLDKLLESVIKFLKKIDAQRLPLYLAAFSGLRELLQSGYVLVSFGIFYSAVNVLEVGKDYYKTERDFLKCEVDNARNDVEKIVQLLEQASDIMTEIVNEASLDDLKVRQFNDRIVQANGKGEECKQTLDSGKKNLKKIFWLMRCRLWAFNGVKCLCTAGVLGGACKILKNCTSLPDKGACISVTFGVCYAIFNWKLDEAVEVYENLKRIQFEFIELELKLEKLKTKTDTENKRMTKRKQSGSQAT